MQTFWQVIRYTFVRRNPLLWLLLVVLPVLVALFVMFLFDARSPLHLPIGVVVQDDSPLAWRVVRALDADASISVALVCPDLPACERAMRDGKLLGTVQLPPGLERKVARGEAPVVPVYLNGQSMVTYNILFKEVRAALSNIGAKADKRNPPDPIVTQLHAIHNPNLDYLAYLGAAMLMAVFHLAAMVVGVYLMGEPLRDRTADSLLAAAGGNPIRAITARLLPALLVLWLIAMFFAVWVRARSGLALPFTEFGLLSLATLAMLAAAMAAGMAWTSFSGNMRMASSTAGVVGGPAFAFSGITFPIVAMSPAVQIYAQILPLTHLLQLQNHLLFASISHVSVVRQIAILCVMILCWSAVGIPLMVKRLRNPHFQGGHREEPFA